MHWCVYLHLNEFVSRSLFPLFMSFFLLVYFFFSTKKILSFFFCLSISLIAVRGKYLMSFVSVCVCCQCVSSITLTHTHNFRFFFLLRDYLLYKWVYVSFSSLNIHFLLELIIISDTHTYVADALKQNEINAAVEENLNLLLALLIFFFFLVRL